MLKKIRKAMFNMLQKSERPYKISVLTMLILITVSTTVYAKSGTPKIVTGTVDLFASITKWLLLIIPVGAGAVLGYHAFQKALSTDQAVIAEKNKLMKNLCIGAAIAETASGLITIILSFYQ